MDPAQACQGRDVGGEAGPLGISGKILGRAEALFTADVPVCYLTLNVRIVVL